MGFVTRIPAAPSPCLLTGLLAVGERPRELPSAFRGTLLLT